MSSSAVTGRSLQELEEVSALTSCGGDRYLLCVRNLGAKRRGFYIQTVSLNLSWGHKYDIYSCPLLQKTCVFACVAMRAG